MRREDECVIDDVEFLGVRLLFFLEYVAHYFCHDMPNVLVEGLAIREDVVDETGGAVRSACNLAGLFTLASGKQKGTGRAPQGNDGYIREGILVIDFDIRR